MPENTWTDTMTLGKAWTSTVCTSHSFGVNEDHRDSHLGVATTMAHEIGHNLGLSHDSFGCSCSDCIMAASASLVPPDDWSDCSRDRLRERLPLSPCLDDTPEPELIYGEPVCGNGLLEKGEDCDCGTLEQSECSSSCCLAAECRFKPGANCDSSDGPCCQDCQLKPVGTSCRDPNDDCDLAEYCSGFHARCPSNVFKRNGESCDDDNGRCMGGICRHRDSHCKTLFGDKSEVNDQCMAEFNSPPVGRWGTKEGNCGEQWFKSSDKTYYFGCKDQTDTLCGKVQCTGGSDRILARELSSIPIRTHGDDDCKWVDWSKNHDSNSTDSSYNFDQMPPGTPCGDEAVCVEDKFRQYCKHLSTMWVESEWGACKDNCTGRGVCNSRGNCHCDPGYGGRACERRGYGGSTDSGYPVKQGMDEGTLMFTLIFSLLFVFIVVGALVAKFHFKRNLTDICFYQPCAGDYRQKPASVTTQSAPPKDDPFRPNWPISSPQGPPPKIDLPTVKLKPAVPPKPVGIFADPFAVDWGDNNDNREGEELRPLNQKSDPNSTLSNSHRPPPPPPKPPTPPPKDY